MSFHNCAIQHIGARAEDYHKQDRERGDPAHVISSSTLREFASCASRWVNGYTRKETAATRWGTLLDCRVLTPDDFETRFVCQPETYLAKDGERKPWRNDKRIPAIAEWLADNEGKEVISATELADLKNAAFELREDETIRAWQEASQTQVWVKGEWHDSAIGLVIPVQCLIDYVPRRDSEFASCLGDLKTTRNADPHSWARWCWQAGYQIQAAWNLDLFEAATQDGRDTFCFILSENFPPWQTAKRMLSQAFTQLGRVQYQAMMARYCRCVQSQNWPDYDDNEQAIQGWGLVECEPWMETQAMLASANQTAPEAEAEEDEEEPIGITP